ncbi:MAG TPA: DUF2723 domain-containing protein [Gemmatirosa sp.]
MAGVVLLAIYVATTAPDVTFWDAGEFLSAFATFGIPHPPGTPLFVALGRTWVLAASLVGAPEALAGNVLSAACTAAAGACMAWLVARWTRDAACGVAAALCAGTMTTVWANATEAEVYAASLALACAALVAGEHAGRIRDRPHSRGGPVAATAYALALAVPLHLSALVVAPAAVWLATVPPGIGDVRAVLGAYSGRRVAALVSGTVLAAGVGTARGTVIAVGAAGLALCAFAPVRTAATRAAPHREARAIAAATLVALSATLILLVRARHDPWLDQGDPSTWTRLVEVVARRQYAVAPLWPRQAPAWLQLANVGEWADWQVALGIGPGAPPNWRRTAVTLAFALLGVFGSAWHRRRDARSWMAVLLVVAAGSVGVATYLNLKAGPSFGAGVLPDTALHEARERDYFFALAWWGWGVWASIGAVAIARCLTRSAGTRAARLAGAAGACVAGAPLAFNWNVSSRALPPAARAAADYARALLANGPPRAVLVVNGDNDTYPLWYAQGVRAFRRDVTPVTASMLPARWYRAELARRAGLLDARAVDVWLGPAPTLAQIGAAAVRAGRPLVVSLATDDATRRALAIAPGAWRLRGLTLGWVPDSAEAPGAVVVPDNRIALSPTLARVVGTSLGDRRALAAAVASAPPIDAAWLRDTTGDGVVAWAYRQLACPRAALAEAYAPAASIRAIAGTAVGSLEGACVAR